MPRRLLHALFALTIVGTVVAPTAHAQALAPTLGPALEGRQVGVHLSADTLRRRPVAVEYSDWYMRRATIHRVASWATLPLFAAEVVTGSELYKNGPQAAAWARDTHGTIAGSLGGLFVVNSVTGLWNLWDARHDAEGRKWRTAHALLMLAADAGFAYTGSLADRAENSASVRSDHRTAALTSSGVALVSYLMMLPPFRRE